MNVSLILRRVRLLFPLIMAVAATAQPAQLQSPKFDPRTGAQFQIVPPLDRAHRIDFTPDFLNWYPLDVLPVAAPAQVITDSGASNQPSRFYRSVEIEPVPEIYSFEPDPVGAGETLLIRGQFFGPTSGANRVTIAGMEARVVEASAKELKVVVPVEAQSGVVRVTTPQGETAGMTDLTVASLVTVQVAPPAGYNVTDFQAGSSIDGRLLTNGAGQLKVIRGMPSVIFAGSTNTNRFGFFAEILTNGATDVILNADSTARALVFINPLVTHNDPAVAAKLVRLIRTNTAVLQLGTVWSSVVLKPGDPMADPEFASAYTNALVQVLNSPELSKPVALRQPRIAQAQTNGTAYVFYHEPPETRWLELELKPGKLKVVGEPFNPVDWVVRFQEINVDEAFPNGRFDIESTLRTTDPLPVPYPVRGGFNETRTVSADLAASRINFVSYLSKQLFTLIAGKGPDDSVPYLRENTIYLMRGVGPAFLHPADYDFNRQYLTSEHNRAIAVNLVAALIDTLSAFLDFKALDNKFRAGELKDWDKFYVKLVDEAVKLAPNAVYSRDDFLKAVAKLSQFFFKEFVSTYVKETFKADTYLDVLGQFSLQVGKASDFATKLVDNKYLKAGSSAGQVLERASGLLRTTPLETAFVVVGDPFKLNVTVTPGAAGPGEEVTVTVRGSSALKKFDMFSSRDQVRIEGFSVIFGQVQSVSGPVNGEQQLRVRIPGDLASSADGNYTLFVNTQGRKGSVPFRIAVKTTVTGIVPTSGFAASSNFDGGSYPGTSVFIQGYNMSSSDAVLFTGETGTVAATSKFSASGGLRVNVPAGAKSGPIRVEHRNPSGEIVTATSADFTVLGPPVIESMVPESGPPGTIVSFKVLNTANDNGATRLQFFGAAFSSGVTFSGPDQIIAPVPTGGTSGPVRIITPSGIAERMFTVTDSPKVTNLVVGSIIQVGGGSVITLERAIAMANGATFPEDDTDFKIVDNRREELDPPREEGDYVTPDNIGVTNVARFVMGLNYSDNVSVTSPQTGTIIMSAPNDRLGGSLISGSVTMASVNCFLSGTFDANIQVSGHFNNVGGTHAGTVIITGNSNRLNGKFTGPVIVEGNNNILTGEYNNTVTVLGEFNTIGTGVDNFRSNNAVAVIVRGNHNKISANFRNNAADVVVLDGAKYCTVDFNNCTTNGGNGLVLKGGASFNTVVMRSGVETGTPRQVIRGSGNAGHAVLLMDGASYNTLSGEYFGNGLDGVLFDGPDVHHNQLNGRFLLNGRNGVTVTNQAHHNKLGTYSVGASTFTSIECNGNLQNGVAIFGGLQTSGAIFASTNGANGLLFSGVNETTPDATIFILLTGALGNAGNARAGLRMEGAVRGVTVLNPGYRLREDAVAVELDGEEVTGNTLDLRVVEAIGPGMVIKKAKRNNIRIDVSKAGGPGITLDGAEENDIKIATIEDCTGPGVLMTGGAAGNKIRAATFSVTIRRTLNGVRVEGGSHDNTFDQLGVNGSGDYGFILTGPGTSRNVALRSTFTAAAKDGVLIEAGASDNTIGSESDNPFVSTVINARDNTLAGIRITGAGTRGNNIIRCLFLPTANTLQPVGLRIEGGAADTVVSASTFFRNERGVLVTGGSERISIVSSRFQSNTVAGVVIENGKSVVVGGPLQNDRNEIFNNPVGVMITGAASSENRVGNNSIHDNVDGVTLEQGATRNLIGGQNNIEANVTGVRVDGASDNTISDNTIANNLTSGVILHNGATGNRVVSNVINQNATGVFVTGIASVRNTITRNRIFAHPLPASGISLGNGGNEMLPAPHLEEVQGSWVVGTAQAPDGSRIELFQDSDDEGETHLASGTVTDGRFRVPVEIDPAIVGFLVNITATVTDPDGNTSQFGKLEREEFPESRLVFASSVGGNSEILSREGGPAGSGGGAPKDENLTRNAAKDDAPAVADGCDQVLFVSDRDGNLEIYIVQNKPNTTAARLTSNLLPDYDPSWLEPCQKIVFVSERDGNAEIYSMNADGTAQIRLTSNPARDRFPRVSPDRTKILFVSNRGGADALWLMNIDGSNQRALSAAGVAGTEPAWSPDGHQIAFTSNAAGNSEIYIVGEDGSGLVRLTNDAGSDIQPAWVPGGKQILFSSNRTGNYEILAVSRNGGAPSRLTVTTADNFYPAAQPR